MKSVFKKLRAYKRKGLPHLGFWLGLLLAQGAPLGLFVHLYFFGPRETDDFFIHMENSWTTHGTIFVYVWVGTSLYFSLFGWAAGKLIGNWFKDLQRSESSLSLFSKFDQLNRRMATSIRTQVRNPVASLLEFKEGLELGFFGAFTFEQQETIKSFLQDIVDLHNQAESPAAQRSEEHSSNLDFLKTLAKTFHAKVNFESHGILVRFEQNLLEAAFAELLSEMSSIVRQKLFIRISQTSSQNPTESENVLSHGISDPAKADYATVDFICLKKKNYGPSWMIAGFILEWHGATLSENENGYRLLIPLSKPADKKGFAA